jgi:hypothetical protein
MDPIDHGPSEFTIGAHLDRPDRTSFFLGYRQIDILLSKAVTASMTYIFSPKYAMTASAVYDFGIKESMGNSLVLTRMGSDLNVSVGVTYNSLQQNFGLQLEVLPNLVPSRGRAARNIGTPGGGPTNMAGGFGTMPNGAFR